MLLQSAELFRVEMLNQQHLGDDFAIIAFYLIGLFFDFYAIDLFRLNGIFIGNLGREIGRASCRERV